MKCFYLIFALLLILQSIHSQPKPQYLHVSSNGRYLQWSDDKPFFLNSCSAWSLATAYTDQEISEYLANRVAAKFNAIQICAVFGEQGKSYVDSAFQERDLKKPLSRFWEHVDQVVRLATDKGLVVMINPLWQSLMPELAESNSPEKWREFGSWFAKRYRNNTKVIYFLGGDEGQTEIRIELAEMGNGIQEVYSGKAILTYMAEKDQSSMGAFPGASWITVNGTHAYSAANGKSFPGSLNAENWLMLPPKPIFLIKGYFDGGEAKSYQSGGTFEKWGNRTVIRRQAWWNLLSGGIGNVWGADGINFKNRDGQTWTHCANYGSSKDMTILKLLVDKVKWWKLQPDTDHRLLVGGFGTYPGDDCAVCAISENKSQAIIYTPVSQSLELRLPDFGQHCRLRWFDPATGKYTAIDMRFPQKKKKSVLITPPGINHSGCSDWVLIIEGSRLVQ